jgi:hypothetical protein
MAPFLASCLFSPFSRRAEPPHLIVHSLLFTAFALLVWFRVAGGKENKE